MHGERRRPGWGTAAAAGRRARVGHADGQAVLASRPEPSDLGTDRLRRRRPRPAALGARHGQSGRERANRPAPGRTRRRRPWPRPSCDDCGSRAPSASASTAPADTADASSRRHRRGALPAWVVPRGPGRAGRRRRRGVSCCADGTGLAHSSLELHLPRRALLYCSMRDLEQSSVVGTSGGRGEHGPGRTSSASPLRRCWVLLPASSPGGRRARPARATLPWSPRPAAAAPTQKTADADARPPTATVGADDRRTASAHPAAANPKPTKKPSQATVAKQRWRRLHNNGGNNGGNNNNGGAVRPTTTAAGDELRHRLDQRAVRPAAGGTEHAVAAADQAVDSPRRPRRRPLRRPPRPRRRTAPPVADARAEGTDDAETYDTYLTSSEPVRDQERPGVGGAGHPARAHLDAGAARRRPRPRHPPGWPRSSSDETRATQP